MKKLIALFFISISLPILAQDRVRMPNLMTFSTLEEGDVRFHIDQRNKAPFDQESMRTFFGLGGGSNNDIGFTKAFKKDGQELSAQFRSELSEYEFSYSSRLLTKQDLVHIQGRVGLFSYQDSEVASRNTSYYTLLSIQPQKRWKKLLPILNIGFSGFTESPIIAFGGDYLLTDTYSLVGEYTSSNQFDGVDDIMTVGVIGKYERSNLMLFIQNSYDAGLREVAEGNTESLSYFLGFRYEKYIRYRTLFPKKKKKKSEPEPKELSEPKPVSKPS